MRIHKPEKYGDDLTEFRKTVVKANKEKKEIAGIEVGVGDLGLRVIRPVFDYKGNHIESVEYGGNLDTKFIEKFLENASEDLKYGGMNISIVSKNLKGEYILVGSNYEKEIEKTVEEIMEKLRKENKINMKYKNRYIEYSSLKDFSNEIIGYIKIEFEIERIVAEKREYFIKSIFIYSIATMLIIAVLMVVFNKIY